MNIYENNRIKMLIGYDVKKTLTENLEPLVENPNVWRKFLGVADNALDDIFKKGTLKTTQGTKINSVDDLKNIFKKGATAALDDASGTLLTQTFLKNPAIKLSDKTSLVKSLTNSDDVIRNYRGKSQKVIAQKFKNSGYPDDVANDIANKLANRSAGSTQGLTAAEKAQYQKLAQAEKGKLGVKGSLGQGTREKLIKKVTSGGKKTTLKATKRKPNITKNLRVKNSMNGVVRKSLLEKWNWKRWLGWGSVLGLSGLAVWWLLAENNDVMIPEDMPITDEGLTDSNSQIEQRYRNCDNVITYTKGCKTEKIKQLQTCLGLVPDGKFWEKTQAALVAKGYKNGFTDADIPKICGDDNPTPGEETLNNPTPGEETIDDVNNG